MLRKIETNLIDSSLGPSTFIREKNLIISELAIGILYLFLSAACYYTHLNAISIYFFSGTGMLLFISGCIQIAHSYLDHSKREPPATTQARQPLDEDLNQIPATTQARQPLDEDLNQIIESLDNSKREPPATAQARQSLDEDLNQIIESLKSNEPFFETIIILNFEKLNNSLKNDSSLIHLRDAKQRTPMHVLIQGMESFDDKSKQLIELFVQHGADLNDQDEKGETPLHYALKGSSLNSNPPILELIELLVSNGASWEHKNLDGMNPIQLGCASFIPWMRQEKIFSKLRELKAFDFLTTQD